jgi:hypothetical protein
MAVWYMAIGGIKKGSRWVLKMHAQFPGTVTEFFTSRAAQKCMAIMGRELIMALSEDWACDKSVLRTSSAVKAAHCVDWVPGRVDVAAFCLGVLIADPQPLASAT